MTAYTLNPESASKAGMSSYISETGSYKGRIKTAFCVKSKSGTDGVEIMFEDDQKRSADYLQVWTNKDGKALMGDSIIHALMACCELRNLTTEEQTVTRNNETAKVPVLKELSGKRVGLLLEKEPYTKGDGTLGYSMVIVMPFEADTGRTAKEKLAKANAEALPGIVARLKDRPMRKPQGGASTSYAAPQTATADVSDDIPW